MALQTLMRGLKPRGYDAEGHHHAIKSSPSIQVPHRRHSGRAIGCLDGIRAAYLTPAAIDERKTATHVEHRIHEDVSPGNASLPDISRCGRRQPTIGIGHSRLPPTKVLLKICIRVTDITRSENMGCVRFPEGRRFGSRHPASALSLPRIHSGQ